MNAICFDLKPVDNYKIASSRFFGVASITKEWAEGYSFYMGEVFLAQFDLEELHEYDIDGLLPDSGFLLLFYCFEENRIRIRHSLSVPDVFDDLNEDYNSELGLGQAYQVCNLRAVPDDGEEGLSGMKLLGKSAINPSSRREARERLLLQIDNLILPNKLFNKGDYAFIKVSEFSEYMEDEMAQVYLA